MGTSDVPFGGQTDIDRLADAARRLLDGEPVDQIAREVGCSPLEVQALADQLAEAGLAEQGDPSLRVRWAPWFARVLRGLFASRHPEPPESALPEPWSEWQPIRGATELELRTRVVRVGLSSRSAPLWAYEFRSLGLRSISFRYRLDFESGGSFPRRVRGLRPGEFYGGMTTVPRWRPPEIDAELVEPLQDWPGSPRAAGP